MLVPPQEGGEKEEEEDEKMEVLSLNRSPLGL
jgi:hypothetical protein